MAIYRCEKRPLIARSISLPVRVQMERQPLDARVLAVFDHACDLTLDGAVIALVTPQIGNGPLNIVVDAEPGDFALFQAGMPTSLGYHELQKGKDCELHVTLDQAVVWEPCPDWSTLRTYHGVITGRLPVLQASALRYAPNESLIKLSVGPSQKAGLSYIPRVFYQATRALRAGWQGDISQLCSGATLLAGLGSGLTPAGDDFMCGVMLGAWLAHPAPQDFCLEIVRAEPHALLSWLLRSSDPPQEANVAPHGTCC